MSNAAIVSILGNVEARQVTTKNGPKTIYSQKASLECEQMRVQIDVEADGPNLGYRVGDKLEWDVIADLVPGQYGRIELARRMSLRPVTEAPKLTAAK